ncbi:MAG: single-stranded DNA-binding protein [Ginsengibacter sp.]
MIKLQIIGHLGGDCTTNDVNGKTVINFNVAHSEKYKNAQGNLVEKTTWVKCAYWTDRTGIAQYLTKGQQVYVEGAPESEGFLNKENQPASSLKVRVFNIQLLGGKSDNADNQQSSQSSNTGNSFKQKANADSMVEEPADDLPF